MDNTRLLHFTAPGFRSRVVDIAPDASGDVPESKRYPLIEESDTALNNNLQVLEVGTKARNRAFQERLDDVWASTKGYDAKMRTEAKDATETILNIREQYQQQIDSFSALLQVEIHAAFDRIDKELYPAETVRLTAVEAGVDIFVKETVPNAIEQQSGVVSRRLKAAYEAFDIEKQKEAKRELKFVNKANALIQSTAQRFADETALMTSNLHQLYDDVIETERRGARMHLVRHEVAVRDVVDVKVIVKAETETRTVEDMDLLDCVIDTQTLLQKTVLEHFGANSEIQAAPSFDKLNARMDKRDKRQQERGGGGGGGGGGGSEGEARSEEKGEGREEGGGGEGLEGGAKAVEQA